MALKLTVPLPSTVCGPSDHTRNDTNEHLWRPIVKRPLLWIRPTNFGLNQQSPMLNQQNDHYSIVVLCDEMANLVYWIGRAPVLRLRIDDHHPLRERC